MTKNGHILMLNRHRCPQCGYDTVSVDSKVCNTCSVRLFNKHDDLGGFEAATGLKHYYVWFPSLGYVYADKITADFKPNKRLEVA